MKFIGIDEAGYGPNLGPMVMAAVIVESRDARRPDVWRDLAATVGRANSGRDRVWIDDSKAIYSGGKGRDRLEATALTLLDATGSAVPSSYAQWLRAVNAGSLESVELSPWLASGEDPAVPRDSAREVLSQHLAMHPFDGCSWKISEVRAEVVGPSRFNAGIDRGGNKAAAHFDAFARLLVPIWDAMEPGVSASVRADKHGGRHYYLEPLSRAFPDAWIDRGEEGPSGSSYVIRDNAQSKRIELTFAPRADADDGLVAMASITAKALREVWMRAFNAHWAAILPGLRPTAGYPADAKRFRAEIESGCASRGLAASQWWRRA